MTHIRTMTQHDIKTVQDLAVQAEMFPREHVGFLGEQFEAGSRGEVEGAHWIVVEQDDGIVGAAYYAVEPFADRMWNLYFIVVSPDCQGQGLGQKLMNHVESALRDRGEEHARVLIVETSSTDQYAGTRRFYSHLGYEKEATIREYYGPDDHKVVFWKSLLSKL